MPPPLPRYILQICRVNSIFPSAVIFRQNAYLFFKTENEQTGRLIFFFIFGYFDQKEKKGKWKNRTIYSAQFNAQYDHPPRPHTAQMIQPFY